MSKKLPLRRRVFFPYKAKEPSKEELRHEEVLKQITALKKEIQELKGSKNSLIQTIF
jgi:hypothetical protein